MTNKYPKYIGKESDFTITVANYLRALGVDFTHVPNEGMFKLQYYKKRSQMGVSKGIPDFLIFNPNKRYYGLAIELKVGYNKPSIEQIQWLDRLSNLNWKTLCSNSLDEVLETIDNYFNNL